MGTKQSYQWDPQDVHAIPRLDEHAIAVHAAIQRAATKQPGKPYTEDPQTTAEDPA